jgi:hypothetical protein
MDRRSVLLGSVGAMGWTKSDPQIDQRRSNESIPLPAQRTGRFPLEECLFKRRSVREYEDSALTLSDVAQLLWAA